MSEQEKPRMTVFHAEGAAPDSPPAGIAHETQGYPSRSNIGTASQIGPIQPPAQPMSAREWKDGLQTGRVRSGGPWTDAQVQCYGDYRAAHRTAALEADHKRDFAEQVAVTQRVAERMRVAEQRIAELEAALRKLLERIQAGDAALVNGEIHSTKCLKLRHAGMACNCNWEAVDSACAAALGKGEK